MATKTARKKPRRLLAEPPLHTALAVLGALFLGWPIVHVAGHRGMVALFVYVFAMWTTFLIVLFLISRSLRRQANEDNKKNEIAPLMPEPAAAADEVDSVQDASGGGR